MDPLAPPRAHADVPITGVIRVEPDDFFVDEALAFEPSGEGEHLLLRIEKRELNTQDVAAELAKAFDVQSVDVSFAGMKDRRAVTRQWFSVRTPSDVCATRPEGWRVIESTRHARKLRRGELVGNAFRIRIRDVGGGGGFGERLRLIEAAGVPNYFGEQRFGRGGANVERARQWVCGGRPRASIGAFERGLHLSTARALLFNAVLAARVADGTWNALIDGDVPCDGSPTGPLWGRGRPAASGRALDLENEALVAYRDWLDPLEHLGLQQERRALVARPRRLTYAFVSDSVELSFELAAGQYATALLREMGSFRTATAEVA